MRTIISTIALFVLVLGFAGAAIEAKADIVIWNYEDDFSTEKAETDSYDHTPFYPIQSYHPLPALCYWPEEEALLFEGGNDGQIPAFLSYSFPLDSILVQVNSGTFELDVFFSTESPFPCYLSYELSENGLDLTESAALVEGHNQISLLPSDNPYTYIKLLGSDSRIDNLSVTVFGPEIPEPTTITLFGLGLLLLKRS